MKYELEVEVEGQEQALQTTVDGRDIRRWEAKNEKSFIAEVLSYTVLTDLAYFSLKRMGQEDGMSHAKFLAVCTGVSDTGGADDEDPT